LVAKLRHLRDVPAVKVFRLTFLVGTLAGVFLTLAGCGRSESADSIVIEAAPSLQPRPGWTTNYDQAKQEARVSRKLVLLDFTGSDWCGWCKLLDKEIFSQPEFKEYASKNLVLVEIDFPKMKPMPAAMRTANVRLAERYHVRGFPTIVVLNSDGEKVGELGYMQGGPEAFIAKLETMREG
jgi:thioredoxin-related protein